MKSCGCFLFGGEYEARTRDLLHGMQEVIGSTPIFSTK